MKLSEHGLNLLAKWEGNIPHVYKDAAGLKTLGVGHLLTQDELKNNYVGVNGTRIALDGFTLQDGLDLLEQDVSSIVDEIWKSIKVDLTQNQFDALVSLTFNIGIGGFKESSVLRDINAKKFDSVPDDFMKWDKITKDGQHVVCDGLQKRRQLEVQLWSGLI